MLNSDDIHWLHRLSGYPEDAIMGAIDRIESWGIPRLSGELGAESGADGHLAARMLCQALDWLSQAGIDESRLLAKFKRPDIWPMWTEIRLAGLIVKSAGQMRAVELDVPVGGDSGHNTDFRFRFTDDPDMHRVEVKALGLSAKEREFCQTWAPVLRSIVPDRGICIAHIDIDTRPAGFNRQKRRELCRDVERWAKHRHPPCGPVSATVAAAHGTREQYVRRLTATMNDHLSQLPDSDVGWMAFHWGNGAPFHLIAEALTGAKLPEHIAGVILGGSAIILDGQMHDMLMVCPRTSNGDMVFHSTVDGFNPSPIFESFETSVGVRPTILRVPGGRGPRELLARDGTEPFWPFNILLSPDPADSDEMVYG